MSVTDKNQDEVEGPSSLFNWRAVAWVRQLRLWSGLILFVFLTMHLINHAAGLLGIEALDIVQTLRWEIWQNPVGITLLYSSLAVHFILTMAKIAMRRTLRMSSDEMVQIALGLTIPVLLLPHVIGTRISGEWFGGNSFYDTVLRTLWPNSFVWQSTLVLVAWGHGAVGIWLAFRHRPWFAKVRAAGLVLAIIIPTLAIAGFVTGGREALQRPPQVNVVQSAEQRAGLMSIHRKASITLGVIGLGLIGLVYFGIIRQRFGNKITITYRGRGPVRVPRGMSILEASRVHGIPHPSVCRGRGRCSTCRVQILSNPADLPEPSDTERMVLDRVGSPVGVRLACQLRPDHDVAVRILLPVLGAAQDPETLAEAERWAVERVATVLSLDLRAFNVLTQSHVPYELVALVNRFGSEMRQAVENHGGHVSTFYGDGLVAVFDDDGNPRASARSALAAARDMDRVLKILNREMGGALPIPVRAGIGIHTGPVTLARIGSSERTAGLMAFGITVNLAARLQRETKRVLTDCLISSATIRYARLDPSALKRHEIEMDGSDTMLAVYAIDSWRKLGEGSRDQAEPAGDEARESEGA